MIFIKIMPYLVSSWNAPDKTFVLTLTFATQTATITRSVVIMKLHYKHLETVTENQMLHY